MRFPDTPFMRRTFALIEKMGLRDQLIDYNFEGKHNFRHYPYSPKGYIPETFLDKNPVEIMKEVLKQPRALFKDCATIKEAIERLTKEYDHYSTRSFMNEKDIPSSVIKWCETMDTSTGFYDRGLTETVLESVAFDWPEKENSKKIEWKCIE